MSGDQRALQLRKHGVFESEDPGPDVDAVGQGGQQVLPDLRLDAALAMPGGAQLAEGAGKVFGAGLGCSHAPHATTDVASLLRRSAFRHTRRGSPQDKSVREVPRTGQV